MRAVVQRVSRASVTVDTQRIGKIDLGLLVLLGAGKDDTPDDTQYLVNKVLGLRIFEDDQGLMNLALGDVNGALLVVSQFTLYGDCRKGRRPSFVNALEPEQAENYCTSFVTSCRERGVRVETGQFGAMMDVELCNCGPVTLLLDSKKAF